MRATVFDAFSYNFRAIVPRDAVFDRMPISQAINLFDMNRCSADVVETSADGDVTEAITAATATPQLTPLPRLPLLLLLALVSSNAFISI